jgi:DNA-binding NarL/FixJ family response regulator
MRLLARTVTEPIPLLEQAVTMLAGSPARLEHTRALVALGAALRRSNRRADARTPLRRALEQADQGGMLLVARRAREELNAVGARPRRSALSGPGALTPAEYRVAQLAARGYGNRAIAERLYVTPRTVETHLTHAFQKLGISSRTELAAVLQPRPAAASPALAR